MARDLIDEPEFKSSYSPKPCLAFSYRDTSMVYDDEACEVLFRFFMIPPFTNSKRVDLYSLVIDSTDGLLLAMDLSTDSLFICNPMTREYVVLPSLERHSRKRNNLFGFGVSKISGQCKVLCCEVSLESCKCYVYTLGGGGSWRIISATMPGMPGRLIKNAIFCNGNLHWLVSCFDFEEKYVVCCFDLETELFTSFSLPAPCVYDNGIHGCILEGRLCFCYYLHGYSTVVIWWMNKYGDENSWVKVYTLHTPSDTRGLIIFPYKVLDNGDLLLTSNFGFRLFIYSKNTKDIKTHSHFSSSSFVFNIATYTPSFLSLEAMGIHNVQSLVLY